MSPTFLSLRSYNYRTYAIGQLSSNTATWMQRVAQDWLVLTLTVGSGLAVGITTALQFAPFLLFAMYGGTLADRFGPRRLLLVTQSISAVLAVTLGVLTISGRVEVWHVYSFAFALGVVSAVDNPTRQAFVSELVRTSELANAVALNSASFNLARVWGPAFAGFLVASHGSGWVFAVNGLAYLLTIGTLLSLRAREFRPRRRQEGPVRLSQGLRYLKVRHDLLLVVICVALVSTFGFNFAIILALMANKEFGLGAEALGVLSTALALGCLVGSLSAARRTTVSLPLVCGAGIAFGLLEAAVGFVPTYASMVLALPLVGVAALTFSTAAQFYLQLRSDGWVRGRVMGVYALAFYGGGPLASLVIGVVSDHFGPRYALVGGGLLVAASVSIAAMLLLPRARTASEEVDRSSIEDTGSLPVIA